MKTIINKEQAQIEDTAVCAIRESITCRNNVPKGSFRTEYVMSIPKLNTIEKGIYHCQLYYYEEEPDNTREVFKLQDFSVNDNGKPSMPYNMEQIWEAVNHMFKDDIETFGRYDKISLQETLNAIAYNVWAISQNKRGYKEDRIVKDLWYYKSDGYVFIGHLIVKLNGYNHHTQTEYVKTKTFVCDWAIPIEIFEKSTAGLPELKVVETELPF